MKLKKNALEWTVFAASVAVILVTAWLLFDDAAASKERRVGLRVETGPATRVPGGYAVPVVVTNDGDATAEQARIEIALIANGKAIETSDLTIAFVPRKSARNGEVVFRRDPACCAIEARTVSYETP